MYRRSVQPIVSAASDGDADDLSESVKAYIDKRIEAGLKKALGDLTSQIKKIAGQTTQLNNQEEQTSEVMGKVTEFLSKRYLYGQGGTDSFVRALDEAQDQVKHQDLSKDTRAKLKNNKDLARLLGELAIQVEKEKVEAEELNWQVVQLKNEAEQLSRSLGLPTEIMPRGGVHSLPGMEVEMGGVDTVAEFVFGGATSVELRRDLVSIKRTLLKAALKKNSGLYSMLGAVCSVLGQEIERCEPLLQSVVSKEAELSDPFSESTQRPCTEAEREAHRAAKDAVISLQEELAACKAKSEAGGIVDLRLAHARITDMMASIRFVQTFWAWSLPRNWHLTFCHAAFAHINLAMDGVRSTQVLEGLAAVNFVLSTFSLAIEEVMVPPPEIRHAMPRFDLEIYAASDVQLDISRSRVILSIDLPEYKASAADAVEGFQQVDVLLAYFSWIWRTVVGEEYEVVLEGTVYISAAAESALADSLSKTQMKSRCGAQIVFLPT